MLGDKTATVTIAVKDIDVAKDFYQNTLGLTIKQEDQGGILFTSGDSHVFVYPSGVAGTNQATYVAWKADDVAATVEELKAKGVVFEQYDDLPGVTRDGDVHTMGEYKAAWFKDPDGNILSIGDM
jgi:catechol 2,3-dioxygenase-like lactoylglutathione lyase family enzyme